jgi:hypothetical protein
MRMEYELDLRGEDERGVAIDPSLRRSLRRYYRLGRKNRTASAGTEPAETAPAGGSAERPAPTATVMKEEMAKTERKEQKERTNRESRIKESRIKRTEKTKMTEKTGRTEGSGRRPGKTGRIVLTISLSLLALALLAVAFFVHSAALRRRNIDRDSWEAACEANTVEAFLAYMEAYPRGNYFDAAQDGLLSLKAEEAEMWERMKASDNVSELRDFLARYPDGPYVPLAEERLDSLVWVGALRKNTPESYSAYLLLAEEGGVRGGYAADARRRHGLLFGPLPVDGVLLDSIRTPVSEFFAALSSLNSDGLIRSLAPVVYRFFDIGAATREEVTRTLLAASARKPDFSTRFDPDMQSLSCRQTDNTHYSVSVPFRKIYTRVGVTGEEYGYIAQLELDSIFQVTSIFETKPYPEAP